MFSSPTASVLFTVVFGSTGSWALYRLVVHRRGPDVHPATELAHLLMSLAMLAMVWDWSGGPDSASGIAQVAVFGLYSLWFLAGALRGSLPSGLHLVSAAAMVWMVVAMAQLMGMGRVPAVRMVTVLVTVLLGVAAALWTRRAVSGAPTALDERGTAELGTGPPAIGRTAVRVADRVVACRRVPPRLDAACQALMNLGMGAVLIAML